MSHFLDSLDSGATPITSGEEERKPWLPWSRRMRPFSAENQSI